MPAIRWYSHSRLLLSSFSSSSSFLLFLLLLLLLLQAFAILDGDKDGKIGDLVLGLIRSLAYFPEGEVYWSGKGTQRTTPMRPTGYEDEHPREPTTERQGEPAREGKGGSFWLSGRGVLVEKVTRGGR